MIQDLFKQLRAGEIPPEECNQKLAELLRPTSGIPKLTKPESSESVRARAERMRSSVNGVKLAGGKVKPEWEL